MKKILLVLIICMSVAACDRSDKNSNITRQCGDYAVQMTFDASGEKMTAVINGDTVELINEVSASGAKYDGMLNDTQVTLWGKGADWVMILDDDTVIECTDE